MDALTAGLLELGPLGMFAGFLIWDRVQREKRVDADKTEQRTDLREIQQGFQKQVSALAEKHQSEIDKIRDRYDGIIAQKDERYTRLTGKLESDLDHIRAYVDRKERE